jgi:hypothetical protein
MPLEAKEPGYWEGPESALEMLRPVGDVLRALSRLGIPLRDYDVTITGVFMRPRPYGFNFRCKKVADLLARVKALATRQLPRSATDFGTYNTDPPFNKDRVDTPEGSFSAGETKGTGFRQVGTGAGLHLEIQENGNGNVHVDSHGYVVGPDLYNWGRNGLLHGYWDLLADKVPGLFGSFGERGQVGPMIRPIRGLDGVMRWYFGLTGQW